MSTFDTLFGRIKNSLQETLRDILLDLSTGNADRDTISKRSTVDSLQLNLTAGVEVGKGEMAYNADEETFDFGMNGAVWQGGLEQFMHVRNNTGLTITDGTPVMAVGTVGASGRILVSPMDGSDNSNAKFLVGVATFDLGTTEETKDGKVTWNGKVRGVDTTGALSFGGLETWNDGDVLYIDPVNIGYLTNVEPEPPSIFMPVAFVVLAHANGTLQVRITPIDESFLRTSRVPLGTYSAIPARNSQENVHGDLESISTGDNINIGDITLTANTDWGLGKMVIVSHGVAETGTITVTGTEVDRDTGVETPAQVSTVVVDTTTTDAGGTDANGQTTHSLTNAYITDKWFTGTADIVLSQTAGSLTDIDIYHCSFEQFGDVRSIHLRSLDIKVLCDDGNGASLSSYMYVVDVTGDKVNILPAAAIIRTGDFVSGHQYRLRKGDIDIELDGRTDGIFVNLSYLGSPAKFRDADMKVWADIIP